MQEFKNTIFILYRESCGSEGLRQTVLNPPSPHPPQQTGGVGL